MNNLYIAVEGLDNAGKSLICGKLIEEIGGMYQKALKERPVNGELAFLLRDRMEKHVNPNDTLAMISAINDFENDIEKKKILEKGNLIQDRFYLSSLAYGNYSQGSKELSALIEITKLSLVPDVIVFVNPPLEVLYERAKEESKGDLYTMTTMEEIERLYLSYIFYLNEFDNVVTVSGMDLKSDINKIKDFIGNLNR